VHKDKQIDLFEIKSGTKVKHRYVNDLALQAVVLERCGLKLRAAFLLHVNPQYAHKEGEDYPPMQLLRSADVTTKVQKQLDNVRRRLRFLAGLVRGAALHPLAAQLELDVQVVLVSGLEDDDGSIGDHVTMPISLACDTSTTGSE
jgi:hypothetical protein